MDCLVYRNTLNLIPGFDSDEEFGPFCHHTPFLGDDLGLMTFAFYQRVASFCTLNDIQQAQSLEGGQELPLDESPTDGKDFLEATGEHAPSSLTGKVNQLEVILRQLQTDLRKEKQDKAVLQAEVQHLRQDNMRLQEESQTAAAQLRKFTEWFFSTIDKKS
ncbi:PREDICTED: signal-induced proliferation-associated 1-like protein 2 [Merops nubicus]|uniref:signal-induced proliferation-associated 1-like protein 2 n=1 Tax=Merops nubicus TaxID=57421 RepID=UPI0004F02E3E|nr:PREDICTED: signal-induced proliferation-associated 1-like protein 2 [Merops nubicus]